MIFCKWQVFCQKGEIKIITIEKENDFCRFAILRIEGRIVKRSQISIFGFSTCSQKYTKG
jgi:hypothetical protein